MNFVSTNLSNQEDTSIDLTSDVYKHVIDHGSEGVLQSIVWKDLRLSSRDGSRLVIRLERRGMIRREKVLEDGRWTYKLTPLRMPVQIKSIEQAPCTTCPWISEWVVKEYRESIILAPQVPQAIRQQSNIKRVAAAAMR